MQIGVALKQSKRFCQAYFEKRDLELTLSTISDGFVFIGTAQEKQTTGREAFRSYLRESFAACPAGFRLQIFCERETVISTDCAVADLDVEISNETFRLRLTMSGCVAERAGVPLLQHVSFAVSAGMKQKGQADSLPAKIARLKQELLNRTLGGGIMGGYMEPGFPFYCMNAQMLSYLGYADEAEFVADNTGRISNCLHPGDLAYVSGEVKRQLAAGPEYTAEYRMRKQNGDYIWVYSVGRAVTVENGRPVIISACMDITPWKEAEQKLEESRRRYQLAVESANISIWEYDIATGRAYHPGGNERIHGISTAVEDLPESMIRQGLVREDCVESFRELYRRLKAGEDRVSGEFWIRRSGQEGEWCERVTYMAASREDGRPARAYGASLDITAQKETERRYAEEVRYREEVEATMLSSCRVNLNDKIVEERYHKGKILRNSTYDETFRRESTKCITDSVMAEKVCRETAPVELMAAFMQGERSRRWTYPVEKSAGNRHWVETTVNLMSRPESGDVLAFFYTKDITREKMLQNTMDTIINLEYDFVIYIDVPTHYYEMVAMRPSLRLNEEMRSGDYDWVMNAHTGSFGEDQDRTETAKLFQLSHVLEQLEHQPIYGVECDMRDLNGEVRRKRHRFAYADRAAGYVVMTRTDIDDVVQAEKQKQEILKAALHAAQEANSAKSDFMARMSHDMRTPMNGIMGLAKLGKGMKTAEETRDYFQKIEKFSEYLMLLINDTLEMNRIESGHFELHPEPLNSRRLFEEIVAMNRFAAEERQIRFLTGGRGNPDRWVLADRERTMQIFNNLLNNAIKFTPQGGTVEFLWNCEEAAEDGWYSTRVIVRDSGIGISKEFLPRLYDAFEQEHDSTLGENMGSGLGLSIVKHLVELMGGEIFVKSEKGRGTEFEVRLTFEASRTEGEADSLPPKNQLQPGSLAGRRVLLCEDHPLNAEIAAKLLENEGVDVDHAENGQVGLDRFSVSNPGYYDAILMDIRMPVLDGLETARRIRALSREDARTIPIIAMTANAFQEDRDKSREAGMNEHLSKPVNPQELYGALSRWILYAT